MRQKHYTLHRLTVSSKILLIIIFCTESDRSLKMNYLMNKLCSDVAEAYIAGRNAMLHTGRN